MIDVDVYKLIRSISEEELLGRIEATSLYDPEALSDMKKYEFRCIVTTLPLLELIDWNVRKCAVVNFPHGYSPLASVEAEIDEAFEKGAAEVDVPVSPTLLRISFEKYKEYARAIIGMARERGLGVKIIVESPLLSDEELVKVIKVMKELEPDFVKTATGIFAKSTPRDVVLIKQLAPSLRVKVAGGIRRFVDVAVYISLGANVVGTSSAVNIIEEYRNFRRMI